MSGIMYNGVTNWRKNNVINKCITEVLFLCETPEQLYCYLLKIYMLISIGGMVEKIIQNLLHKNY